MTNVISFRDFIYRNCSKLYVEIMHKVEAKNRIAAITKAKEKEWI